MKPFAFSNFLPILYIILSAVHLYAEWVISEGLILVTKPLLLAILAMWVVVRLHPLQTRLSKFLLGALVFSWGGDIFLMLVNYGPRIDSLFLAGLGSFLIAQLCYAIVFWSFPGAKSGHIRKAFWKGWPLLMFLAAIIGTLWPGLSDGLRVPVVIYASSITAMAVSGMNLRNALSREVYLGLMSGILLFLISDSLIGLSKFRPDSFSLTAGRVWIMATYLGAQLLITANVLKGLSESDSTVR
jgi:uncharacterized membrane protein YhhN